MELSDKAYSAYILLQRFMPLMDGLESAKDDEIKRVCKEIADYLDESEA